MPIWTALRKLLGHHHSFPGAQWVLPNNELDELQGVYDLLSPEDPVSQRSWLFADTVHLVSGKKGTDWDAQQKEIAAKRHEAIATLLSSDGLVAVQKLVVQAERPDWVGVAFAEQASETEIREAIEAMLGRKDLAGRAFVRGLIVGSHCRLGNAWSETLLAKARTANWDSSRIVEVLLALPSNRQTWQAAAAFGEAVKSQYWKSAQFWQSDDEQETLCGARELVQAGRARDAVHQLGGYRQPLPSDFVVELLTKALEQPWSQEVDRNEPVMFQWAVCQLLNRLDQDPTVSQDRIARLEWAYLALLEHSERPPVVLHRFISQDPAFFVQVLSAIYRPHSEKDRSKDDVSEEAKRLASQAFRLLESWKLLPGSTANGLEAAALKKWTQDAQQLATAADRSAVAGAYIGKVLAWVSVDADGVWPAKPVRDLIEEMKNEHIENGLVSGVHNKRGVTSRGLQDGGDQERGLAKQYRRWADALKFEWPHTAALLNRIARSFESTAAHYDDDAEFTDWH
jgi:hypothetical protein